MKGCIRLRILSILFMVLVLLITAAFASASDVQPDGGTASSDEISGSLQADETEGLSGAEAVSAYINSAMYFKKDAFERANASSVMRGHLTKTEVTLYDALLDKIQKVAAGKLSSTEFVVSVPKVSDNMVKRVHKALLADCASELYWYDKTDGIEWRSREGELRIKFFVASEYSAYRNRRTTKIDTSTGSAVQAAVANAKQILTENRGKSDIEKLRAYKNKICELNEYNYWAVSDPGIPYGNPWQLIWVFDGNPNTKVVCEGYAKAFQYLCDMSSFGGNVSVMSMSGSVLNPDGSEGKHMWNVVTMSDRNRYLVDVTFCDEGDTGSDRYFLVGYDGTRSTAYGNGYVYNGYTYVFARNIPRLYKKNDTKLSPAAFDPSTDPTLYNGGCGADVEWAVTNAGVLKIGGNGPMEDYGEGQAPWSPYAGSIKKITISDGVTRIGNNAFAGLKKVKSVTGGKGLTAIGDGAYRGCSALSAITLENKVKRIGSYAFSNCKKLKTVNIRTTKLKKSTVGSGAFKKISGKATFICPEKKQEAYRKLLLKKGAPKKATFK